jgi:hypothetical protein
VQIKDKVDYEVKRMPGVFNSCRINIFLRDFSQNKSVMYLSQQLNSLKIGNILLTSRITYDTIFFLFISDLAIRLN